MEFIKNLSINVNKLPEYKYFKCKFTEEVPLDLVMCMLKSTDERLKPKMKALLNTYRLEIKNDKVITRYSDRFGLGRHYPQNHISLSVLPRIFKNTVFSIMGFIDIDLKKSHPNIINSIARKNNIELAGVQYYINNFDAICDEFRLNYSTKLSNDQVKYVFNMILYGGSFSTWCEEIREGDEERGYAPIKLNTDCGMLKCISDYETDVKLMNERIIEANPDAHSKIMDNKKSEWKNKNKVMSYFLGTIENHILYSAYCYLIDNDYTRKSINNFLAYDGLTIDGNLKNHNSENIDYTKMIDGMNECIKKCCGLDGVVMVFKEFKEDDLLMDVVKSYKYEKVVKYVDNTGNNCPLTDYDIAKEIASDCGKDFVFIEKKVWYSWDDTEKIWIKNDGWAFREVMSNRFYDLVMEKNNLMFDKKKIIGDQISLIIEDKNKKDEIKNLQTELKTIDSVLMRISKLMTKIKTTIDKDHILKSAQDILRDTNFEKTINTTKYVLPFDKDKMIDLKTNDVYERTKVDKFSHYCDVKLIELSEEQEKDIREYFMALFCQNNVVMQCFINIIKSIMTGQILPFLFICVGDGRNGKSLLFKVLNEIFGEFMDTISKAVLIKSRNKSHITTELEKLKNIRLGFISEVESTDEIDEKNMRSLTGGDKLNNRGLAVTDVSIINSATMIISTNEIPGIKTLKANRDRVVITEFLNNFEGRDNDFENKLLAKKDLIFSFIMKFGKVENFKNISDFPPEMISASNRYFDGKDYLKLFINDCITILTEKEIEANGKSVKISATKFRQLFDNYCRDKVLPLDFSTQAIITARLKKEFKIEKFESNGTTKYLNIVAKTEVDDNDEEDGIPKNEVLSSVQK